MVTTLCLRQRQRTSQVTEAELSYVAVPEPGLHNGRHEGTRCAQGNLVVFVDDDIIAAPGWLQAIVETFQDPEVHIVGGAAYRCTKLSHQNGWKPSGRRLPTASVLAGILAWLTSATSLSRW